MCLVARGVWIQVTWIFVDKKHLSAAWVHGGSRLRQNTSFSLSCLLYEISFTNRRKSCGLQAAKTTKGVVYLQNLICFWYKTAGCCRSLKANNPKFGLGFEFIFFLWGGSLKGLFPFWSYPGTFYHHIIPLRKIPPNLRGIKELPSPWAVSWDASRLR